MPIPFPPDGPQVKAALSKIPEGVLQDYRKGTPPQVTGQVTPGPTGSAAEALNARGAMGAAGLRQKAMNNKVSNSTIFQQKDAELAQKAQQLQQQEQQLGVLGALMAKKAQDMQARESMGVANLPVRPDMFTAMDGGIVFSGGGAVQRFNGQQGPSFIGGISPEFGGGFEDALINATFRADRKKREQDKVQYEFLKRAAPDVAERFAEENPHVLDSTSRVPSIAGEPEPTIYAKETKKSTRATTPSTTSAAKTGVASLSNRPSFEQNLETLRPYLERSPEEDLYSRALVDTYNKIVEAVKTGKISEEDAKKIMEAKKAELATQYQEYTKGRGERMEKIRSSLEGEAPSVWSKLAAGLPTDTRGMRLGSGIASIAKGYVGKEEEYAKRKRDAAKYMAEVEELNAKADLLEKRGQTDAAERARAAAEKRAKEGAALEVTGLQAKAAGIQPLLTTATAERGRIGTAAGQLLGAELDEESRKRLLAEQARLTALYREPREPNIQNTLFNILRNPNASEADKSAVMMFLDKGKSDKIPPAVQTQIVKDIAQKYADPHDPRVIAAVEKVNPNAAKILRLKPNEAKNQPDYSAALGLVEQLKYQEIMANTGQSQSYTTLPSPPSK